MSRSAWFYIEEETYIIGERDGTFTARICRGGDIWQTGETPSVGKLKIIFAVSAVPSKKAVSVHIKHRRYFNVKFQVNAYGKMFYGRTCIHTPGQKNPHCRNRTFSV